MMASDARSKALSAALGIDPWPDLPLKVTSTTDVPEEKTSRSKTGTLKKDTKDTSTKDVLEKTTQRGATKATNYSCYF